MQIFVLLKKYFGNEGIEQASIDEAFVGIIELDTGDGEDDGRTDGDGSDGL